VRCNQIVPCRRRSGFTLIELLVVIAIIAILAALLLGGVMVFLRKGPEVKNRNDILQLSEALQKFKNDYGRYPPSQIRLRANMLDYRNKRVDALDDASVTFLNVMFKSLGASSGGATNIQWGGVNFAANYPNGVILEGDQCLVFFLGGPPIGGGQAGLMGGFTVDPTDPVGGAGNRKKCMDFETNRLINRGGNPFPSYVDSFDLQQPFIYFSASGFVNTPTGGRYGTSYDSVFFVGPNTTQLTNSLGVRPYLQSSAPVKYQLPDSFQIISAGADGQFGPGGLWSSPNNVATGAGADDFTNISDKKMGVP
jgi:prepilin-type N-terminal cleavage/methylation domain-containing protein